MSEWWTYRLSDFLLFAPRTYYRLFERYNAEVWPAHVPALAVGLTILVLALRADGRGERDARPGWEFPAACLMLAGCWLGVAVMFHLRRYAEINWAATGFGAAFALQAGLLLVAAGTGLRHGARGLVGGRRRTAGRSATWPTGRSRVGLGCCCSR